jgi:hypothetical protein
MHYAGNIFRNPKKSTASCFGLYPQKHLVSILKKSKTSYCGNRFHSFLVKEGGEPVRYYLQSLHEKGDSHHD